LNSDLYWSKVVQCTKSGPNKTLIFPIDLFTLFLWYISFAIELLHILLISFEFLSIFIVRGMAVIDCTCVTGPVLCRNTPDYLLPSCILCAHEKGWFP